MILYHKKNRVKMLLLLLLLLLFLLLCTLYYVLCTLITIATYRSAWECPREAFIVLMFFNYCPIFAVDWSLQLPTTRLPTRCTINQYKQYHQLAIHLERWQHRKIYIQMEGLSIYIYIIMDIFDSECNLMLM